MSGPEQAPNYPEYHNRNEYLEARDSIRDEAAYLTRDVTELGELAHEADAKIREGDRQLVALEMDAFRSAYHDYKEQIDDIFERLDWSGLPPDLVLNPGTPSEDLARRGTMIEFAQGFAIHHELSTLRRNEDVRYELGTEGYGINVKFGRDGTYYEHDATEDEIKALRELIGILGPRYRDQYDKLINRGTE